MKRSKLNPCIFSLAQYKVRITEDIQQQLCSQYEHIKVTSTHGDNEIRIENATKKGANLGGKNHFTKNILNAMKSSPSVTVCRVNLILANDVDKVLDEINHYLARLYGEELISHSEEGVNNKNSIIVNIVKFKARKHHIFHDVIEIHEISLDSDDEGNNIEYSTEEEVISLSSYSSIPSTLCTGDGIFSNWPSRQNSKFPLHYKVIICDRFCGEAVLRGSNIFVRGILAADRSIEQNEQVCVYAHVSSDSIPRGLTVEHYNGECVFLGLGKAACTRAQMFNQSTGLGVIMFNHIIYSSSKKKENKGKNIKTPKFTTKAGPLLPSMNGILSNKIMLQNLPSTVVAHTLNPQPKDIIVDLCCAPGGKTSHVASLVNNDATIVACDKSRKKIKAVKKFFEDMGASCITPIALDSTKCILNIDEKKNHCWKSVKDVLKEAATKSDGLLDVKGFYPESFDKIVLDPPCSALGLRPKLVVDIKNTTELNKHAEYQRKFIQCAVSLLKPGGILVYSTCTINACENEEMVKHTLDKYKNMKLIPIEIPLGSSGLEGCGLKEEDRCKVRRFDPSNQADDTMGFFVAKFVKENGEQ